MVRVDMQHSMTHFIHVHQTLQQSASCSESACDRALLLGKQLTLQPVVTQLWLVCEKHLGTVPPMPSLDFAGLSMLDLSADPNSESDSEVELFNEDFVSGSNSDSELDVDSD